MNIVGWLFQDTPLPWLAVMYLFAYRHDLFRLAKPFRDKDGLATWWWVCKYLGLTRADAPRPPRRVWSNKSLLLLAVGSTFSLLSRVAFIPLAWYGLVLLQVGSGFVLFLALVIRIGPLPTRPYCDSLPYPRLGTRIRHLAKAKTRGQ